MTKKFFSVKNFWAILKIGAWTAFAFLVILFFLLIPTSIEACGNPKIGKLYMIRVFVCLTYLGVYFWLLILKKIKGKTFKAAVAILSVLIIISCTFLIKTTLTNKRIQTLENRWQLSLPTGASLSFFDYHALGFVDLETFAYYVFKLKSEWTDGTCFLNNRFPQNTDGIRYFKFPEQKDKISFRLVFQQLLEKSMFDFPSKVLPQWYDEPSQWGLQVSGNNRILFGVFYPKTMQLILFEYCTYD